MEVVDLSVEARDGLGTPASNALRKAGFIPIVLYGGGKESIPLKANAQQFFREVSGRPTSQVYRLVSPAEGINSLNVIVKERQTEPLKGRVLHVDLVEVIPERKLVVTVPLELVGEIPEVRAGLAIMQQSSYDVAIECDATDIPEKLVVDISELKPGQALRACDISLPQGVKLKRSGNTAVLSVFSKTRGAAAASEGAEAAL